MGITGPAPPGTPIAIGANKVRAAFKRLVTNTQSGLKDIRELVDEYGRPELAAELGDDAADMLSVYNGYKTILNSDAIPGTCPDLPN